MQEAKCRQIVAERAQGLCEKCGQQRGSEMHHRKNRSQGGRWTPSNIIHLCNACHVFVTQNPLLGQEGGWCIKRNEDPELAPVVIGGRWVRLCDDSTVEWIQVGRF